MSADRMNVPNSAIQVDGDEVALDDLLAESVPGTEGSEPKPDAEGSEPDAEGSEPDDRLQKGNTAIAVDGDEVNLDDLLNDLPEEEEEEQEEEQADEDKGADIELEDEVEEEVENVQENDAQEAEEGEGEEEGEGKGEGMEEEGANAEGSTEEEEGANAEGSTEPVLSRNMANTAIGNDNDEVSLAGLSRDSAAASAPPASATEEERASLGDEDDMVSEQTATPREASPDERYSIGAGVPSPEGGDSRKGIGSLPPGFKDPVQMWRKLRTMWSAYRALRKHFASRRREPRRQDPYHPRIPRTSPVPPSPRMLPQSPLPIVPSPPAASSPTNDASADIVSKLQSLAQLANSGLLTPDEYKAAKQVVLDSADKQREPSQPVSVVSTAEPQRGDRPDVVAYRPTPKRQSKRRRSIQLASYLPPEMSEVIAERSQEAEQDRDTLEPMPGDNTITESLPSAPDGWAPEINLRRSVPQKALPQTNNDILRARDRDHVLTLPVADKSDGKTAYTSYAVAPRQPVSHPLPVALVEVASPQPVMSSPIRSPIAAKEAPPAVPLTAVYSPEMEAALAALMTTSKAEEPIRQPPSINHPPHDIRQSLLTNATSLPSFPTGANIPEGLRGEDADPERFENIRSSAKFSEKRASFSKLTKLREAGLLTAAEYEAAASAVPASPNESYLSMGARGQASLSPMHRPPVVMDTEQIAVPAFASPSNMHRSVSQTMQAQVRRCPSIPAAQLPYTSLPAVTPMPHANQLFERAQTRSHSASPLQQRPSTAALRSLSPMHAPPAYQLHEIPPHIKQAIDEVDTGDDMYSLADTTMPPTPGGQPIAQHTVAPQAQYTQALHSFSQPQAQPHYTPPSTVQRPASPSVLESQMQQLQQLQQMQQQLNQMQEFQKQLQGQQSQAQERVAPPAFEAPLQFASPAKAVSSPLTATPSRVVATKVQLPPVDLPKDRPKANIEEIMLKRKLREVLGGQGPSNALQIAERLHAINPTALLAVLSEVHPRATLTYLATEWRSVIASNHGHGTVSDKGSVRSPSMRTASPCPVPSLAGKGPFKEKSVSPPRRRCVDPQAQLIDYLQPMNPPQYALPTAAELFNLQH